MFPGPLANAMLRGERMASRGLRLYVCAVGVAFSSIGHGGCCRRGIYFTFICGVERACLRARLIALDSLFPSYLFSRRAENYWRIGMWIVPLRGKYLVWAITGASSLHRSSWVKC